MFGQSESCLGLFNGSPGEGGLQPFWGWNAGHTCARSKRRSPVHYRRVSRDTDPACHTTKDAGPRTGRPARGEEETEIQGPPLARCVPHNFLVLASRKKTRRRPLAHSQMLSATNDRQAQMETTGGQPAPLQVWSSALGSHAGARPARRRRWEVQRHQGQAPAGPETTPLRKETKLRENMRGAILFKSNSRRRKPASSSRKLSGSCGGMG